MVLLGSNTEASYVPREKLQPKFSVIKKQLQVMPYVYITDEQMGWDNTLHFVVHKMKLKIHAVHKNATVQLSGMTLHLKTKMQTVNKHTA